MRWIGWSSEVVGGSSGAWALSLGLVVAAGCRPKLPAPPPPEAVGPVATPRIDHPRAAITLEIPEGWQQADEDGALTLTSESEEIVMIFVAIAAKDLEESLGILNTELARLVEGAEIAAIEEIEVGGMVAMIADGRGSVADQPVELRLMLLRVPAGETRGGDPEILLAVSLTLADASPEVRAEAEGILRSTRQRPRS